ncbi:unnamed protein product [Rhizoctonia solani]|uniref:Peptidase A1 domain-containing protein n=1 Tax=Rhizoctonia solani TaxID=456999 RepID=A0A8H3B711_9AGAM|nr:unnamed protein product [Rhizoctonia solani]
MSAPDLYQRNGLIRRCPGGFSVQAARNHKHRHDGPTDYAKCVRKYKIGGAAHTPFFYDHQGGCVRRRRGKKPVNFSAAPNNTQGNIRAAIADHEVNQDPDDGMTIVPAQDIQNDTEYACPVTIGTPGETLTLDFDTGSADLWVWSSQARVSKADMKGRGIYDPKKSRTSKRLRGHTWEVRYGDGSSASGVVYMDTIVIGDITVENQAVEVARELSDDFLQAGCDGLVGLGFPRLNQVRPNRQKTPMENMVEQGVIKDPIFTVKLDKRDSRGFYTFGFIDETVHCSKLYWQDVDKGNGWWEVPSAYIKIGDEIYDRGHENTAIIDTGTTLVLLDDETVEKLYSKIEGATYDEDQGGYIFPTKSDIPHLAFCVGRWLFTMPGACVCHCKHPDETKVLGNIPGNIRVSAFDRDPVNLDPDDGMTVVQANDIQNDTEYACPVTIGTPGVTLTLDFDTGSSDLWVWSSEFRASRAQLEGHKVYNPHNSRTAQSLPGATWNISYGDGSHASGDVVMETVTIGDITIKGQAVEVAQQLSDEFLRGGSDGLLGLGFPKLNTVRPHQQKTPMQNMVEQGLVKDPIFTVKLDKHDSRGFYTFGYINEHDTGTTLILMDDETVERLYSQIPGARLDRSMDQKDFPCMPIVTHDIDGTDPTLYKIGATNHTPFFFDEVIECVFHHKHPREIALENNTPENPLDLAANLGLDHGMTIIQAEDIQNDSEYACPVTVGTPGVTLVLDFDTGSSDLWVRSSEFRARRTGIESHRIYNPHKSRTAEQVPGATWNISYGDGSHASGNVVLDTVTIGDITIKNQAVEVSQHLSDEFLKDGSDGLFGLAFPKLNTVKPRQQKSPMQNMVEQGLVKDPIFTVKLDKHDSHGFYTFGYISEHIHASKLYWREVITDNGWWEVASPYVKIGSKIYDRGHSNTAIIDTGTTLILMDDKTIEHLYSQILGAKLDRGLGGYVFPTDAHVPELGFSIGKWLFTIPSEDLAFSSAGSGMSYGAIQSRGQNKQDILGDVFLKHVYVVFDQGTNPRIGVAQRN